MLSIRAQILVDLEAVNLQQGVRSSLSVRHQYTAT